MHSGPTIRSICRLSFTSSTSARFNRTSSHSFMPLTLLTHELEALSSIKQEFVRNLKIGSQDHRAIPSPLWPPFSPRNGFMLPTRTLCCCSTAHHQRVRSSTLPPFRYAQILPSASSAHTPHCTPRTRSLTLGLPSMGCSWIV